MVVESVCNVRHSSVQFFLSPLSLSQWPCSMQYVIAKFNMAQHRRQPYLHNFTHLCVSKSLALLMRVAPIAFDAILFVFLVDEDELLHASVVCLTSSYSCICIAANVAMWRICIWICCHAMEVCASVWTRANTEQTVFRLISLRLIVMRMRCEPRIHSIWWQWWTLSAIRWNRIEEMENQKYATLSFFARTFFFMGNNDNSVG